ncbi:hypothetical protein GJ700_12435 [Duganella sp. FT92W]|uniref:Uncharacterized protein n=1 Tax=Pseudoduganella rivuli TaxID=2666085 RepID=A0A7X2IMW6_9BURK|nr:hypothetical protein [Pseudoduganella rivuli]MRV72517.1 hypothetical protein [Pseudoduganella rivuli]
MEPIKTLPTLPGCLADRLFEAISIARDSAENDGSIGRIRKWEATAAGLRAALAAQPAAPVDDRRIADTVNALRDVAVKFHDAQQLRERIAHIVVPLLKAAPAGEPVAKQANPHAATFPPEIWLNMGDCDSDMCTPWPDIEHRQEITWCWESVDRMDVRYIRADIAAPVANAGQAKAVAVPDEWTSEICGPEVDDLSFGQGYRRGFNDCRAKVLAAATLPQQVAQEGGAA